MIDHFCEASSQQSKIFSAIYCQSCKHTSPSLTMFYYVWVGGEYVVRRRRGYMHPGGGGWTSTPVASWHVYILLKFCTHVQTHCACILCRVCCTVCITIGIVFPGLIFTTNHTSAVCSSCRYQLKSAKPNIDRSRSCNSICIGFNVLQGSLAVSSSLP